MDMAVVELSRLQFALTAVNGGAKVGHSAA